MEKYQCKTNIISMNFTSDVSYLNAREEVEDGMICNFHKGKEYIIEGVLGADNDIFLFRDEYGHIQFFIKMKSIQKCVNIFIHQKKYDY